MKKKYVLFVLLIGFLAGCGQSSYSDKEKNVFSEEVSEVADYREETLLESSMSQEEMDTEIVAESENATSQEEAVQEEIGVETELPEAYREVLDDIDGYIHDYFDRYGQEIDFPVKEDETTELTYQKSNALREMCMDKKQLGVALFHNGYMLYDIDGNGVQELIIASDMGNGSDVSIIYTLNDGRAVCLIGGWCRSRVTVLEEGTIYNEGSSGAAYNDYVSYRIGKDGSSLEIEDCYFSEELVGESTVGWFHNTEGRIWGEEKNSESVDTEVVEQFQKEFKSKPKICLELTCFFDYENAGAMDKVLVSVEEMSQNLTKQLETETLTQAEKSAIIEQMYQLWDDELNHIWKYLKNNLDESVMKMLTEEEREWIDYKESEMQAAGATEFAESDKQIMLQNEKGAYLTRNRVYELYKYLEKTDN